MCESGLPNSVLEIKSFWRKTSYNIGGQKFSLDDIEHGILIGMDGWLFEPDLVVFSYLIKLEEFISLQFSYCLV